MVDILNPTAWQEADAGNDQQEQRGERVHLEGERNVQRARLNEREQRDHIVSAGLYFKKYQQRYDEGRQDGRGANDAARFVRKRFPAKAVDEEANQWKQGN